MSSTHCFLRTKNRSICLALNNLAIHYNTCRRYICTDNVCARSHFAETIPCPAGKDINICGLWLSPEKVGPKPNIVAFVATTLLLVSEIMSSA